MYIFKYCTYTLCSATRKIAVTPSGSYVRRCVPVGSREETVSQRTGDQDSVGVCASQSVDQLKASVRP